MRYKGKGNKRMRIYIAGPLNAPDAAGYLRNVSQMLRVANQIRKKGHAIYVPALDLLLGVIDGGMSREEFLDSNLPWIEVCDALFLIGMSDGVLRELAVAEKLGKKVYVRLDEVPELR